MNDEEKYIQQRRRKAYHLAKRFRFMNTLPIQNNKIVFSTFEGDGGFCCNPRYIAEALHKTGKKYEMIWLLHDIDKEFPDYITPVKDTPWNIAYHLATAKVWIDNYRKPLGTHKRKGQLYIQTWHASMGFKAVGAFRGKLFPKIARIVSEADSSLIDYVLSNSDYCTSIYPKKLFYSGPVLQFGSPRCDCLIKDKLKLREALRLKYNLPLEEKIVLYAPTFRGGSQKGKKQVTFDGVSLDIDGVLETLATRKNGHWTMALRLHPQLAAKMKEIPGINDNENIIDLSQEDDMSQVLGAADLLITDYSSCAFDALFAQIPVILYADDIEEYKQNRGAFMWQRKELPFLIAENNAQLKQCISDYDVATYENKRTNFMLAHNVVENGDAAMKVANVVEQWMKNGG